jgi:hypothetical protein
VKSDQTGLWTEANPPDFTEFRQNLLTFVKLIMSRRPRNLCQSFWQFRNLQELQEELVLVSPHWND